LQLLADSRAGLWNVDEYDWVDVRAMYRFWTAHHGVSAVGDAVVDVLLDGVKLVRHDDWSIVAVGASSDSLCDGDDFGDELLFDVVYHVDPFDT
jgi:hypothetical protein